MELNLCFLFLCFQQISGNIDVLDLKIDLKQVTGQHLHNNILAWECSVPEKYKAPDNKGFIKWFQIKGNFHENKKNSDNPFSRISSYIYKNGIIKQIYQQRTTEADHNTAFYCTFQKPTQSDDVPDQIISNHIPLYLNKKDGKSKIGEKESVKIKSDKIYNSTSLKFHVTCERSKGLTYIEMYEIKGNVLRYIVEGNSRILNSDIEVSDNNTAVYCRGFKHSTSDNFYSSNIMRLYYEDNSKTCENCREIKKSEFKLTEGTPPIMIIVVCALVFVILMLILAILFCSRRRRPIEQPQGIHQREQRNLNQVLYAEIDVSKPKRNNIPEKEETPYAQIICVLKSRMTNNNHPVKIKDTVKESPYASPYAQVIIK